MTWTDLSGSFGFGAILTSSDMQSLRDNAASVAARESDAPFNGGGWGLELLKSFSITSLQTIDIESVLLSTYEAYELHLNGLTVSSGANDLIRYKVSINNGSTYDATANAYQHALHYSYGASSSDVGSQSYGIIGHSNISEGNYGQCNFLVNLNNPFGGANNTKNIMSDYGTITSSDELRVGQVYTAWLSNSNYNAIQFYSSTGYFSAGDVYVYGLSTNSF